MNVVSDIVRLLHVLASFALVGGEIARIIVFQRAKQSTELKTTATLLQLATFFSTKLVSPGGMLTVLLGLITAGVMGGPVFILGFILGGKINWVLASLVLYIILMVLVFSITMPRSKAIGQALGAALGQGKITPELTAAMNDQTLNTTFLIQNIITLLMIALMVLKPF